MKRTKTSSAAILLTTAALAMGSGCVTQEEDGSYLIGAPRFDIEHPVFSGQVGQMAVREDHPLQTTQTYRDPFVDSVDLVADIEGKAAMAGLHVFGGLDSLMPGTVYRFATTESSPAGGDDIIVDDDGDTYVVVGDDDTVEDNPDREGAEVVVCNGEQEFEWDYDDMADEVLVRTDLTEEEDVRVVRFTARIIPDEDDPAPTEAEGDRPYREVNGAFLYRTQQQY